MRICAVLVFTSNFNLICIKHLLKMILSLSGWMFRVKGPRHQTPLHD